MNVQPLDGGTSAHVAAHAAENCVATHIGAGSFLLSGINTTVAQQIAIDCGQSDAVAQVSVAFVAQVAAQAFVCAERFAQHT
jgi:hypothetical protein